MAGIKIPQQEIALKCGGGGGGGGLMREGMCGTLWYMNGSTVIIRILRMIQFNIRNSILRNLS